MQEIRKHNTNVLPLAFLEALQTELETDEGEVPKFHVCPGCQ